MRSPGPLRAALIGASRPRGRPARSGVAPAKLEVCWIECSARASFPAAGVYPFHQEPGQLPNRQPYARGQAGVFLGELGFEPGFTQVHTRESRSGEGKLEVSQPSVS